MSSISQEESIEGVDPMSSFDKYEHRKPSNNYSDTYLQGSNSKYNEYPRFQNTGNSSPCDQTDSHRDVNGSQTHDESEEYIHEDSKLSKENYRTMTELEAVQERSVEHSEMTNKMSYMESEAQRWGYDDIEDTRISKSIPNLPRSMKEVKPVHEPEENAQESRSNEKGTINTFISPRFQMQSSEKKQRSRSRSRETNEGKSFEKEDPQPPRKQSQNNFNALYNETFNKKTYDPKMYNHNEKEENTNGDSSRRRSSPSEKGYAQKIPTYLSSRVQQKASPRNRQNLSALELNVQDRGNESYENRRLNKTEVVAPHSREDSFQGQDYSDLVRVINFERERNEKLEEKINNKEKLLKQMKEFHEKIYQDYLDKKNELEKANEEKENLMFEINKLSSNNVKLAEKNKELEVRLRVITEEREKFIKSSSMKDDAIRDLEQQISSLNTQMDVTCNKYESKIASLTTKLNRKGQENREAINYRERLMSDNLHVRDPNIMDDEEKLHTRKNVDDSRSFYKKSEDLTHGIDTLKKANQEKGRAYRDKSDDSFLENRRKNDENLNLTKVDMNQQVQQQIYKYKQKIAKLKAANENLQLELESRPTMRRYKENEMKIQYLENELEEVKHQTQDQRKSTEVNLTTKILRDIIEELEIENIGEILPKIKELQENSRANTKFANSVVELVYRCSPGGYFEKKPSLKQAWKWIKRLMEEYMSIKKEGRESEGSLDQEILRETMDYLMVDDTSEISNKLRNVLVENNLMKRVINKIKAIHNLERVNSIQDLERRLESMTNSRQNGSEPRNRYYQMSGN